MNSGTILVKWRQKEERNEKKETRNDKKRTDETNRQRQGTTDNDKWKEERDILNQDSLQRKKWRDSVVYETYCCLKDTLSLCPCAIPQFSFTLELSW